MVNMMAKLATHFLVILVAILATPITTYGSLCKTFLTLTFKCKTALSMIRLKDRIVHIFSQISFVYSFYYFKKVNPLQEFKQCFCVDLYPINNWQYFHLSAELLPKTIRSNLPQLHCWRFNGHLSHRSQSTLQRKTKDKIVLLPTLPDHCISFKISQSSQHSHAYVLEVAWAQHPRRHGYRRHAYAGSEPLD